MIFYLLVISAVGVVAIVCGWVVWHFIILPSVVEEVNYPLSNCDTSMCERNDKE